MALAVGDGAHVRLPACMGAGLAVLNAIELYCTLCRPALRAQRLCAGGEPVHHMPPPLRSTSGSCSPLAGLRLLPRLHLACAKSRLAASKLQRYSTQCLRGGPCAELLPAGGHTSALPLLTTSSQGTHSAILSRSVAGGRHGV